MLEKRGIVVLVFTISEDETIHEEFLAAGLHPENYMTKSEGGDIVCFLTKVNMLLREKHTR
jgi:hypothetical protein